MSRLDLADPAREDRVMRIDLNADLGESFGVWRLGDDERTDATDSGPDRRADLEVLLVGVL